MEGLPDFESSPEHEAELMEGVPQSVELAFGLSCGFLDAEVYNPEAVGSLKRAQDTLKARHSEMHPDCHHKLEFSSSM